MIVHCCFVLKLFYKDILDILKCRWDCMAKQQNLEKVHNFYIICKEFCEKSLFLMESELEYQFPLNYLKHAQEYSNFSVKIIKFLWRWEGTPSALTPSNELLAAVWGADTRILGKLIDKRKIKEKSQNSLASGFRPEPQGRIEFLIIPIFYQVRAEYFLNFWNVITFLNFTNHSDTFLDNFQPPWAPLPHFPPCSTGKLKKFGKISFFLKFSQ